MPCTVVGMGYLLWRAKKLVANGMEVTAEVVAVGKFGIQGMRDITLKYMVDEQSYEKKTSVTKDYSKSLEVGDTITLIVDPKSPKTFLLRDE